MQTRLVRLRIETDRHLIEGVVQLPHEGFRSRVTDFLNAHDDDFIAVTDATISPIGSGMGTTRHEFLAVSVRHIVVVAEMEE
jgi:hypothetical protein